MKQIPIFFLATIILLSGVLPAFAEVAEFQLDKNSYGIGDSINVKGNVFSDASGLVTIVLRDPSDQFVLLSQAVIQPDNSFEKIIPINQKFQIPGSYNATAFVLNMTAGKTQSFNFDTAIIDKNNFLNNELPENFIEFEPELIEESLKVKTDIELKEVIKNTIPQEPSLAPQEDELIPNKVQIADFVDKAKNPQHYLERYYNEPNYKDWFDKNYPTITIEEAVGFVNPTKTEIETLTPIVKTEIFPEAEALSVGSLDLDSENNSEFAHLGLAVGGLAVLFGAVYGVKRKVDSNTKHISLNKDIIRRKIISPIIDSNPLGIIETRLAKGEISIAEYEELRQKLNKNSK